MGCGSCGTKSADGKPSGCQSNGGCSTGGCNRLNVYNWLADLPISDLGKPYPIIEISFSNGSRKDFFRNNTNHIFDKGAWVAVEGSGGFDIGQISLMGELVKLQMKKYGVTEATEMKRVIRPAAERDLELYNTAKEREKETLVRARAIAKQLNLEMKIAEAEFQADGKKISFFYTADSRVDFRELIKVFASEFRAKVEMRQIGARQESGKVGGIGSCGRELCCSTWLTDFKTVNTTAARYQNLSINQTKLSGQCGRLKCCLNYELDTYMDALHSFPEGAEQIEVAAGRAYLQKKDIFRNLMWYSFGGSNKQYPLTIERVREIQVLNADGVKPEDLGAVEIQIKQKDAEKTVDMGFVNDVGQLTLSSLSKSGRKKQQGQNNNNQGKQLPRTQQAQEKQRGKQSQQNRPQPVAGEKPQQQNRPPREKGEQQAVQNKPQANPEGNKQAGQPANKQQAKPQQQKQQQKNQQLRPQQARDNTQEQQPAEGNKGPRPQGNKPPQARDNAEQPPSAEGNRGPRPQQANRPQQPRDNAEQQPAEGAKGPRPQQQKRRPNNRPQQKPNGEKNTGEPNKEQ